MLPPTLAGLGAALRGKPTGGTQTGLKFPKLTSSIERTSKKRDMGNNFWDI